MSVPDGLLILLREGPRHGYQLATEFAAHTAGRWKLNTGQVYTTLERLVRDGFAEPAGTDPDDERRIIYRLTDTGAARAEDWLVAAPPAPTEQRDELVLRILLVTAAHPSDAPRVIDAQRRSLVGRLQELRRGQRGGDADLLERLAADAAATRIEADLAWLDRCEDRLRAQAATPSPHGKEER